MRKWPYFIVASLLNALLVTGAFIEFKLRGIAVIDLSARSAGFPAWNDINPFQFAGGMFLLSLLVIVTIAGIIGVVTGIFSRLHSFKQSLANGQLSLVNGES
jgi:hypothetical protein